MASLSRSLAFRSTTTRRPTSLRGQGARHSFHAATLTLPPTSLASQSSEEEARLTELFGAETASRLDFDSNSFADELPSIIEEAKQVTLRKSVPKLIMIQHVLEKKPSQVRLNLPEPIEDFSRMYHYSFRGPMDSEDRFMRRSDMSRLPSQRRVLTVRNPN